MDLEQIDPETYPAYQRVSVFANRLEPALKLQTILGKDRSSKEITLHYDGLLENWLLAPDNRHIALVYYISGGGFDGTAGHCVDTLTGKVAYHFQASDTPNSLARVYFSAQHQRMISNHTNSFNIDDLPTGRLLHQVNGFVEAPHRMWGNCFAINPLDPLLVAISYGQEPYSMWDKALQQKRQNWRAQDYIHSVVIARLNGKSPEANVVRSFQQVKPIEDLAFSPDGDFLAILLSTGHTRLWHWKA